MSLFETPHVYHAIYLVSSVLTYNLYILFAIPDIIHK